MNAPLRQRLHWPPQQGAVFDGPRRYLLMRPDVLMGAVAALPPPARQAFLQAFEQSARQHGGASLQAYAEQAGGDRPALVQATVQAAADLGWGRWEVVAPAAGGLALRVHHSPFVAGWRAAGGGVSAEPVCAPVRGLFAALGTAVLGRAVRVRECRCAAQAEGGELCEFEVEPGA